MLTLTRQVGQTILIGNNIKIMVRKIRGNSVSLGIEAPKSVVIYRKEVLDRFVDAEMIGTRGGKSK